MTMYNDALMGQRVRLLIRAKYGSAKACSRATGITEQTIGKMQKVDTHKGSMHLDTIARVADSLGTSIDYLVGRINKDPEKAQYTPYNQDEIAERAFYARCHNKLTVSTVADHAGLMHCVVNNIYTRWTSWRTATARLWTGSPGVLRTVSGTKTRKSAEKSPHGT